MVKSAGKTSMQEFNYDLPPEKIALFPLEERLQSKLLVYRDGIIEESVFSQAGRFLQKDDFLILNETRVVQARLRFQTNTGAMVELFCLEPAVAGKEIQTAMQTRETVEWRCLAGNLKRWKNQEVLVLASGDAAEIKLEARLMHRDNAEVEVQFSWQPKHLTFAELLDSLGKVPLPPYLRREAENSDKERYQTVFARNEGSVAAPTAGLHFTKELMAELQQAGIQTGTLTLHVGAGTFRPVTADDFTEHEMHSEEIHVQADLIENLAKCKGRIIPVGTTSLRTLESIYWHVVKCMRNGRFESLIQIEQWYPYQFEEASLPEFRDACKFLYESMSTSGIRELAGSTKIIIAPGYKIRTADLLFTNFHQPGSTLLLLVSACIGNDWRRVYEFALTNGFRFLSYGDSSLLKIVK